MVKVDVVKRVVGTRVVREKVRVEVPVVTVATTVGAPEAFCRFANGLVVGFGL